MVAASRPGETLMMDVDVTASRLVALQIAAHVTSLEERVPFAEAIVPLVNRFPGANQAWGVVIAMMPRGLPADQWAAVAEDHLNFLFPPETVQEVVYPERSAEPG
jgi:hypothetical protein